MYASELTLYSERRRSLRCAFPYDLKVQLPNTVSSEVVSVGEESALFRFVIPNIVIVGLRFSVG